MATEYKPKHVLLCDFSRIMSEHDLMNVRGASDEYESEALSVLGRFNESALQACEDAGMQKQISEGIVRQAFEFWFAEDPPDVSSLAATLLTAYLPVEQAGNREVLSNP